MRRYDVRPVDPTVHIVTVLTVALILGTQLYGPDELHGDCRQVPKQSKGMPDGLGALRKFLQQPQLRMQMGSYPSYT